MSIRALYARKGEAELALRTILRATDLRPNFSEVSRKTGIPTTTLWDAWQRLRENEAVRTTLEFREIDEEPRVHWRDASITTQAYDLIQKEKETK